MMGNTAMVIALVCAMGCGGDDGGGGGLGERCEREVRVPLQVEAAPWDEAVIERTAPFCAFGPGSKVEESVGPLAPGLISPQLKHVIVLLRENRSFDHLLGGMVTQTPPLPADAEVTNPDPSAAERGAPVARFHEQHYCTANPAHEWSDVHLQHNNGQLDGFVAASNRSSTNRGGCVAMGYYNRDDLPLYGWLVDNFAISENYHSSLLGPTMPNISFYFFATSCGVTDNAEAVVHGCPDRETSIFEALKGKATSAIYIDSFPASLSAAVRLTEVSSLSVRNIDRLQQDLANDQLPEVVFIEPNYGHGLGTQNDEHPPSNMQEGQAFVFRIVDMLMKSTVWQSSVMFITWDEHGGYYDHVPPPDACAPDDYAPTDFAFNRFGFRTPFFAISPFARKGYISRYTADHTSILRFIEAWKGLGALTRRDANAWPLLDMFDFSTVRTDVMPPDPALAVKSTDPVHVASCANLDSVSSSCAP